MIANDLWGDLPTGPAEKAPVAILKEQAQLLGQKTNQLLEGRVRQRDPESLSVNYTAVSLSFPVDERIGLVAYDFSIIAPTLNNYEYSVLTIVHSLNYYPLQLYARSYNKYSYRFKTLSDQQSFEEELRAIFGSEEIRKVIAGLLGQIRSA